MSKIEEVARAIKRAQFGRDVGISEEGPWREFELSTARAAIEAMSPKQTKAMVDAGVAAYELIGLSGGIINTAEDHVELIFQIMIDAALSEEGR